MMGPRDSVIALLKGETPPNPLFDTSPWVVVTPWTNWLEDFPELWIDKIHDHVGEEYDDY